MRAEIELDPVTCRALLGAGVVARLAFWAADGPRVQPMNYTVLDESILLRTRPGSALARLLAAGDRPLAAVEVDGLDHADQVGWSVQARGPLEIVSDDPEADPDRLRPVRPWASGERDLVVRLRWEELTGRQLGTGWDPLRAPAYRRLS